MEPLGSRASAGGRGHRAGGGGEEATAAAAAAAAADLADASLRAGAFLHGVRASLAAGVSAPPPPLKKAAEDPAAAAELAVAAAEAAADRALLRAFHAALKARALERALEAAGRLCLTRSLEGALKLANHHRVPALAERVSALLSARLEMEQAMANAGGHGTPARNTFGASRRSGRGGDDRSGGGDRGGSNPFMRSSSGAATGLAPRSRPATPMRRPPRPPSAAAQVLRCSFLGREGAALLPLLRERRRELPSTRSSARPSKPRA